MPLRIIEVTLPERQAEKMLNLERQDGVIDLVIGQVSDEKERTVRLLCLGSVRAVLVDMIESRLGHAENWRLIVIPVEATLPRPKENEIEKDKSKDKQKSKSSSKPVGESREVILQGLAKGAVLDSSFIWLTVASTIVAAIGLIEDNIAVIIGAMVIAPLLGPNLAFSVATAMGDKKLMWQSAKTNLTGIALTLALCAILGAVISLPLDSVELMSRTDIGMAGVALALASGAAGALSLTTGLSASLVGVMVAVALMPPASVLGMMLGAGEFTYALGAALMLAVNVVCVNLSAQFVFIARGIVPRTWQERKATILPRIMVSLIWISFLAVLMLVIWLRQ